MADLGTDVSAYPDYDPLGTLVSGNLGLCQRIARRLTNSRGGWFWAPNECTDLRAFLNDVLTQERQSTIKNIIEREIQREECVKTVEANISISQLSTLGQVITVHITGSTGDGPFKFVLNVTAVTLAILNLG